ncbi:hypothetical protein [Microvirga antarctica]|uniref:hypothetical protein n=1 Tax=Microvirga antarctica TaxID=2819233 RepID=UPI001B311B01|nr:hypothetical protein [Microvirga antarctica]
MIPGDPKMPPAATAADETVAQTEDALDEALEETFPASDAINLRQWSEMEASERARAEREERLKAQSHVDRLALYARGPTAFSA